MTYAEKSSKLLFLSEKKTYGYKERDEQARSLFLKQLNQWATLRDAIEHVLRLVS